MRTTEPRPAFGIVRSELAVIGMNCTSCARHVETALTTLGDVSADVDIVSASAVVTHPATLPVADLVAAIEDAGYVVVGAGGRIAAALPEAG
jgi:Cu+-exporting ATPase